MRVHHTALRDSWRSGEVVAVCFDRQALPVKSHKLSWLGQLLWEALLLGEPTL